MSSGHFPAFLLFMYSRHSPLLSVLCLVASLPFSSFYVQWSLFSFVLSMSSGHAPLLFSLCLVVTLLLCSLAMSCDHAPRFSFLCLVVTLPFSPFYVQWSRFSFLHSMSSGHAPPLFSGYDHAPRFSFPCLVVTFPLFSSSCIVVTLPFS